MSKEILTKLAEDLQQLHHNQEPVAWLTLADAVRLACKAEEDSPQATADGMTREGYARAYRQILGKVVDLYKELTGGAFNHLGPASTVGALEVIQRKCTELSICNSAAKEKDEARQAAYFKLHSLIDKLHYRITHKHLQDTTILAIGEGVDAIMQTLDKWDLDDNKRTEVNEKLNNELNGMNKDMHEMGHKQRQLEQSYNQTVDWIESLYKTATSGYSLPNKRLEMLVEAVKVIDKTLTNHAEETRRMADTNADEQSWRNEVIDHAYAIANELGLDKSKFDRHAPGKTFIRAEEIKEFMTGLYKTDKELEELQAWKDHVKRLLYASLKDAGLATHYLSEKPDTSEEVGRIIGQLVTGVVDSRHTEKKSKLELQDFKIGNVEAALADVIGKMDTKPVKWTTDTAADQIYGIGNTYAGQVQLLKGEKEALTNKLEALGAANIELEKQIDVLKAKKPAKDGTLASWREGVATALVQAHVELVPGSVAKTYTAGISRTVAMQLISGIANTMKAKTENIDHANLRVTQLEAENEDLGKKLKKADNTEKLLKEINCKLDASGNILRLAPHRQMVKGDKVRQANDVNNAVYEIAWINYDSGKLALTASEVVVYDIHKWILA